VGKNVEGRAGAVGKLILACTFDEIQASRKIVEGFLYFGRIFFESRSDGPRRKGDIEQTARFQHVLFGWGEAFNLELDHLRKRVGDAGFDFLQGRALLPMGTSVSAPAADKKALRDEMMQGGNDEEWIAFGSLVNEGIKTRWQDFLVQFAAQDLRDGLSCERCELNLARQRRRMSRSCLSGLRACSGGRFAGAIGGQHHELGGGAATGESGDEIEGGIVGPVEIFEDEDEGRIRAELFEAAQRSPRPRSVAARRVGCCELRDCGLPALLARLAGEPSGRHAGRGCGPRLLQRARRKAG
jgi:hypothetical protein